MYIYFFNIYLFKNIWSPSIYTCVHVNELFSYKTGIKKVGYLSVSDLVTSKHFLSICASIEGSDWGSFDDIFSLTQ